MKRNFRILMVDDDAEVLRANEQYLTETGYEVCCAQTLESARRKLHVPPDLILLDVRLPDGSGYDFCRDVRKVSNVPIIFLTALGGDGDIIGGLSLGGDDYIVKPCGMGVLGARIAACLRRRGLDGGRIDLPPLHIDIISGAVRMARGGG
ncbi:MAG: response regulator transcription factor [Clostridiales bacterium]|jgi:DNA-binding response OmpR family regulator|nr:response regulator transcription factor [Clostridiales bacterium]